MASAIERLKAFARAAADPMTSRDRRLVAETGLPVVEVAGPDLISDHITQALQPLAESHNFPALAAAFDTLFATKAYTSTGYRTYRIAQELLLEAAETAVDDTIGYYADWWQRDRTDPAAAGAYARALLAQGYSSLGQDVDVENLDDQWAGLCAACGEARSVLAHAGPRGRRHWLWRQADFALTFSAWAAGIEDPDQLLPAFAAVQTLDPHEFGIYDDRTLQLLPRWSGSFAALDKFARASADRTAARFGSLLYARIYDVILAHEDPDQTLVDPQRLMRAFDDWIERFPEQPLINRYAAHAHAFGDLDTVERLFGGPLREIHPARWLDRDQPLEAWRSISKRRRATAG